ncbi:hypothetical protein R3W88_011924 [Solanum pinnatisectum]|uniref:Uncharacterized protein n=1 Tax=Solanum pinnatisectum TaxID=50273 RepID=A0AAV9L7I1_9SOLN|nr:hypothetical protein R3W88_011924 [Solanum pinnatisectum]
MELPIRGRLPLISSIICPGDFLSLLELYIFSSLRYVWRLEGYDEHQHKFACIRGVWIHMRPRVFIMFFLGIIIFFGACDPVEVLHSLTTCIRGQDFFRGCNMLLRIWEREHFYCRDPQMDYCIDAQTHVT